MPTISGDVATLLGESPTNPRTTVTLTVQASQPVIMVDDTGHMGGSVRVPIADDGTFSLTGLPATTGGVAPLYRLVLDARSLRLADQRPVVTGWFPLTSDRDLGWIVDNYVQVTLVSAQVAANIAAAAALGATNDTATASYINDPDSATARALARPAPGPIDYLRARLAQTASGPVRAMMLGSSTAAGAGASRASKSFTELLVARIQRAHPSGVAMWEPPVVAAYAATPNLPGFHLSNASFGGTTTADYVGTGTLLQAGVVKPHIYFHCIGQNDYRNDIPPATVQANLASKMASLDAATPETAVHVLIGSYAMPIETSPAYPWSDYLNAMRDAADAHPRGVFVDTSAAFIKANASGPSAPDPLDLISSDNTHATDAGHALLAAETTRALGIATDNGPSIPAVLDRFTRKTLGSTETGHTWAQQGSSVHVPNGTYLTCTTAGNIVVETGFSDAEVSAVITYSTTSMLGVLAKSTSDTTRLFWGINPTLGAGATPVLVLYMGTTLLAAPSITALSPTLGQEFHLRLVAQGNLLIGYLDGREWARYTLGSTDATTYSGYTQHGVRCNGTTNSPKWRNFAVRAL